MIKVLFHIDTLSGGGAEKVLQTLVNHMNPDRFDITVQTLYREDWKPYLNPSIHYRYIYPKKSRLYSVMYRLEAETGMVYRFHMRGDYDVECAYLECGPTKVLAASTNKKAKKIAWVHCDLAAAYGKPFAEKTEKWYRKYDRIACVSEQVEKSFINLFGTGMKTSVIHNVVDSAEIIKKSCQQLAVFPEKSSFTMLSVARLTPPKNLIRLLKTQQKLLEDGIKTTLWIVGEGEERQKLEAFIDEHQMQKSVKLWGYQENPYPFMKIADLLVCSSDYEGFSTFVTEGLILGKPIITTKCSGMEELLGKSEYGIITDNEDVAFYNGLKQILLNKEKEIPRLAKLAAERGRYFTTDSMTSVNERFIEEGLAGLCK